MHKGKITIIDRFKRAIDAFWGKSVNYAVDGKRTAAFVDDLQESQVVTVCYICNGKACESCRDTRSDLCEHTSDIRFAQNFHLIDGTDIYMEK